MIVSGKNGVFEALCSKKNITKVMISKTARDAFSKKIVDMCKGRHIRFDFLDKKVLDKISKHSQGYIADIEKFKYCDISEILKGKKRDHHLIVILDGIQDPHNLGNIIRTCECTRVDGIILPVRRSGMVNETVYKASVGSVNYVKIARATNINEVIKELKRQNIWVYGADAKGTSVFNVDLNRDVALVIGSEGEGVHPLTKKLCDEIISLPMFGRINSLNVSSATSALIYEILRQMNFK